MELQQKIEQDGIGVSESFEKNILMIMGGQSLEATPHMKFCNQLRWVDDTTLRSFALLFSSMESLHLHIENCNVVVLLFSPVNEFSGTIRTTSSQKLASTKKMWKHCVQRPHLSLLFKDYSSQEMLHHFS